MLNFLNHVVDVMMIVWVISSIVGWSLVLSEKYIKAAACLIFIPAILLFIPLGILVNFVGPSHKEAIHNRTYTAAELDFDGNKEYTVTYIYAKPKTCEDWWYFHSDHCVRAVKLRDGTYVLQDNR